MINPVSKQMLAQFFHRWFIRAFALLCLGGVIFAATKKMPANRSSKIKREAEPPPTTRVLMIGDSLSVGKFGEVMRDFLVRTVGPENVALYASCGSSPQDWMRGEPDFFTKCGYRAHTPSRNVYVDWANGRPPPHVRTPKVDDLVREFRPTVVVVQLGTNWMDAITAKGSSKESEDREIADRFLRTLLRASKSVQHVIWITPPDSSHFTKRVQGTVENIIRSAASQHDVYLIRSRSMTRYVPGKTGGDGVHYNSEASISWAQAVTRELLPKLREYQTPPAG